MQKLQAWKELSPSPSTDKSSENEQRTRFLDRMVKASQDVRKETSESDDGP